MKLHHIISVFLAFTATSLNGQISLTIVGTSPQYRLSDNSTVADNTIIDVGFLDEAAFDSLTSSQQTDYVFLTGVSGPFSSYYSSDSVFSGGSIIVIGDTTNTMPTSTQLSVIVFDDSNNEIGIFSSSDPDWTSSSFSSGTTTLNSNLIDSSKVGSFTTGSSVSLAAIPEPSTYAAIFGALALGGVIWQRRRKKQMA